jgi:aspartyl-tRNA(Asn)/glutamyl-tRNA(Gln) amidotransferase subunit B
MPKLLDATHIHLQTDYGLSMRDVDVLISADSGHDIKFDGKLIQGAVAYFDDLCVGGIDRDPKVIVN